MDEGENTESTPRNEWRISHTHAQRWPRDLASAATRSMSF